MSKTGCFVQYLKNCAKTAILTVFIVNT